MTSTCPFCVRIASGEVVRTHGRASAFADAYPVSDGHLLVVPHRHVADVRALDDREAQDLWALVQDLAAAIDGALNIGVNVGAAAGQTIDHAHVHLIPRRAGDVADPRGGVRWVIPARAPYWE